MASKKATEEQAMRIELPKMNIKTMAVKIVGDSPLIVHKWTKKAKEEMLGKQMKKAAKGNTRNCLTKKPIRHKEKARAGWGV